MAAQSARALVQPLPVHQAASGGAPAAKTIQGEPLRTHVNLSDAAGPGATTGQQAPRRTVSVPGEEQAAEAAPEPPTRALPVKSSLAGSSIKGSKPQWMLRADQKSGSSLKCSTLCTTVLLHARCRLHAAEVLCGLSVHRNMQGDKAVRSRSGPACGARVFLLLKAGIKASHRSSFTMATQYVKLRWHTALQAQAAPRLGPGCPRPRTAPPRQQTRFDLALSLPSGMCPCLLQAQQGLAVARTTALPPRHQVLPNRRCLFNTVCMSSHLARSPFWSPAVNI